MPFYRRLDVRKLSRRFFAKVATSPSPKWESVVGLEIHAQILSKSKLFSAASTDFSNPVNTNVSPFDAAIPGTLPVLNRRCVEAAVQTALALSCRVNAVSMFDRKHYFYADLPAGYQITQQRNALANDGGLAFLVFTPGIHKKPYRKAARLKQLQLEQDSGKSLYDAAFMSHSLVDLNRAGIPLMELVFEPDLSDGEEAAALVKELVLILQRLQTCSCKMEEGALRVDANISVRRPGDPLGVRTEIKNIGSIRAVAAAVKYEIDRQIQELEAGGRIMNETRAWDSQKKATIAMRDKEVVQDYRFMPEPNLPPLHLNMGDNTIDGQDLVNVPALKRTIPVLPEESRTMLVDKFNLTIEQAIVLVNENILYEWFQKLTDDSPHRSPKTAINILLNELLTVLNKEKIALEKCTDKIDCLGEAIDLLQAKKINLLTVKKVLEEIFCKGSSMRPTEIVQKENLLQITDDGEIRKLCEQVLAENPELVKKYKNGKSKLFKAFMGMIANASSQRVDMATAARICKELLEKD